MASTIEHKMAVIDLTVRHGRNLDEARERLERAVAEVSRLVGGMIQRVDWNADRTAVHLAGTGFVADMGVDSEQVHVTADLPFLNQLVASPVIASLRGIVERTFRDRLASPRG